MTNRFHDIGINSNLEDILKENRITEPTPVQKQAIPELLKGKDVIAEAYTGTGKTFAFMLPILQKIDENKSNVQALIITPTRELAIQITNETDKLTKGSDINVLAAYGGQDVEGQLRKLKRGVHIVIGTPGRLLDHVRRGSIDLGHLQMLVIDEADEILQMGFLNDVEDIIRNTPKQRQTMLFSATIPNQLHSIAKRYMKNPVQIKIRDENVTLDQIKQLVIETTHREKQDELLKIIDEQRPFMAIIFCRTKRRVIDLNNSLIQKGYNSDEIHGDLSQSKRERVMRSFRKMEIQLLVATDVAARGLDIDGITHIFNYDIPENVDSYIHRIGRTGRAGESGQAITFVTPGDKEVLGDIERKIKKDLTSKGANSKKKKSYKNKSNKKNRKNKKRKNKKRRR